MPIDLAEEIASGDPLRHESYESALMAFSFVITSGQ